MLTQTIREHGTMLGKIVVDGDDEAAVAVLDPGKDNLVAEVSVAEPYTINPGGHPRIRDGRVDEGIKRGPYAAFIII